MVEKEQKKEITSIIDNIKKDLKNIEDERNNLSNKYQIKLDSINQIDKLLSTSDNIVDALSEIENKLNENKENTSLDLNKKLSTLFTYIKEQINKIEDKISTIKDEYQKVALDNNKALNEQSSLLKEQYEKLSLENNQQLKNLEHKIEREAHIMSQVEKENISYRTAFNDIKAFEVSILQLDDLKQTVENIQNIENNLKKDLASSFDKQNEIIKDNLKDFSLKDIDEIKESLNLLSAKVDALEHKISLKDDSNLNNVDKDNLSNTNLDKDTLSKENLDKDNLSNKNLDKDTLSKENLDKDDLSNKNLDKDDLSNKNLDKDDLSNKNLDKESLSKEILSENKVSKDEVVNSVSLDKDTTNTTSSTTEESESENSNIETKSHEDSTNNESKKDDDALENKEKSSNEDKIKSNINKEILDFIVYTKDFLDKNEKLIKDSDVKLEKELIKVQQSLNELISSNNIDKIDIKNLLNKDDKDIMNEIDGIKEFMSIFSNQVIYKIDSQDRQNKKLMKFIYFIAIVLSCTTLFSIVSLFAFFFTIS